MNQAFQALEKKGEPSLFHALRIEGQSKPFQFTAEKGKPSLLSVSEKELA